MTDTTKSYIPLFIVLAMGLFLAYADDILDSSGRVLRNVSDSSVAVTNIVSVTGSSVAVTNSISASLTTNGLAQETVQREQTNLLTGIKSQLNSGVAVTRL